MITQSTQSQIRASYSKVFRKLWIKRRSVSTGLFETDWVEITKDVKQWGRVSKSIDYVQYSKVRFSDVGITVANDYGRYNPEDDAASLWYGYASQQRTLVKIEAGFTHQTLTAAGIYTNTQYPSDPTIFVGVIQGDVSLSEDNEVNFTVKPLTQVFRDYPTRNLTGFTTTGGMTAKQFITLLRDQTLGSSQFVFRPFFGDTTTYWNYTSSAISYVDISDTIASAMTVPSGENPRQNDFYQMNVWEALTKLGEAEDLVPYVNRTGQFNFTSRAPNTTTAQYSFFGRGFTDSDYGVTIKRINRYTKKLSDYYSRVEVKWLDSATTTAIVVTQTSMVVNGSNTSWLYGYRTFALENFWIGNQAAAQTLASTIFTNVSSIKNELDFSTSFVPHLELLDRVAVSYESTEKGLQSRWDVQDWADESATQLPNDLLWVNPEGDAIRFNAKEFKLVSIDINLDTLETRFVGVAL